MRFLEYLFFKYYYFQVKVGNGDVAPFSTVLFMGFVFMFVFADIFNFYYFFIPGSSPDSYNSNSILSVTTIAVIGFSFMFLYKRRYKKVLEIHETEWKGKKNLGAVLFAVVPFILFVVELFIPMKVSP